MLLGYYTLDGRLTYAGRAGTGMDQRELRRLWERLQPLAIDKMPLDKPPPRDSRFGSPLKLSRVHWVRPELVVEVTYLTWTDDRLLRHVVYEGMRDAQLSARLRPVEQFLPGRLRLPSRLRPLERLVRPWRFPWRLSSRLRPVESFLPLLRA